MSALNGTAASCRGGDWSGVRNAVAATRCRLGGVRLARVFVVNLPRAASPV